MRPANLGKRLRARVPRRVIALAGSVLLVACSGPATPPKTIPADPAPAAAAPDGLVPVPVRVPDGMKQWPFDIPRQALLPPGWTMSVWARVDKPRLAAWTPDGDLLISVPADGLVMKVRPGPAGTGRPSVLLSGLDQPHGLGFRGNTLYVGESDQINTYTYEDGVATDQRVLVGGLPDARSKDLKGEYEHTLKTLAIAPDGTVYFCIGSTGNVTVEDRFAAPERAAIHRVPPGGGPPQVFARGVRNGTGLAVAPDGSVWTVVNNRDWIQYPYDLPYGDAKESSIGQTIPDYVNEHPPEIVARLFQGRDLGWPYCNPDADVEPGKPDSAQRISAVGLMRDWAFNRDGAEMDCAALSPVEQLMPAHSAPLGMSFVDGGLPEPYAHGALVGVHGSWNRTPPRAPEVAFFPWKDGRLGPQQTLVGGFQYPDGERWGRPVAAVIGPDGAVYVTDDGNGSVYRLAPPGR
jgi:glucose/arabinose dehydrogenase